jgi:hypothetical protein
MTSSSLAQALKLVEPSGQQMNGTFGMSTGTGIHLICDSGTIVLAKH